MQALICHHTLKLRHLNGNSIAYESIPELDTYKLLRPVILQDDITGKIYGIPAGFQCDGASIPWFLPETGACEAAGFVHDFLYRIKFIYEWNVKEGKWEKRTVTRAIADEFYRSTCMAYGSVRIWAFVQWLTLRVVPLSVYYWWRAKRNEVVWDGADPSICEAQKK